VACIPATLVLQRRMALRYNPTMYGSVPIEVHSEVERKMARRSAAAARASREAAEPATGRDIASRKIANVEAGSGVTSEF
jgi:hypothetical protein